MFHENAVCLTKRQIIERVLLNKESYFGAHICVIISLYSSIPCSLGNTSRRSCLDTIENFRQIYHFLASNNETRTLLSRFRLWPLIFIPRDQNTGDFLFVRQIFWTDPIALLSTQDTIADTNGRIPIRSYYDNDPVLQEFFLDALKVELQPTIDDYLPLLSTIQDTDIWKIIEIITKLAVEQNKQQEVRGKENYFQNTRNIFFV